MHRSPPQSAAARRTTTTRPAAGRCGFFRVLGLVALTLSCTSSYKVPREELIEGAELRKAVVFRSDGTAYRFDRVALRGDSLVGLYPVSVEKRSEGGVSVETVMRSYPIAMTQIDSVAVIRRDMGKTALVGAGVVALGALLRELGDTSLPTRRGPRDGTKEPPG